MTVKGSVAARVKHGNTLRRELSWLSPDGAGHLAEVSEHHHVAAAAQRVDIDVEDVPVAAVAHDHVAVWPV